LNHLITLPRVMIVSCHMARW